MWPLKKKLTTASVLVALALTTRHADNTATASEGRQCPRVVVSCADRVPSGQPLTYTVSIERFEGNVNPTYKWTTSAGTISSGQGTSAITVDTTGISGMNAEATVEVGGLSEGCPKTASCVTAVPYVCTLYRKYDEYGDLPFSDEKARLDNFAIELQNSPGSQGYIIAYGGRVGRAGEAQRSADRVREFLVNQRGIDASRIVTVDGGYREEPTVQLYLVGAGDVPPAAEPTVDPTEVKFVKESKTQGRSRRRP